MSDEMRDRVAEVLAPWTPHADAIADALLPLLAEAEARGVERGRAKVRERVEKWEGYGHGQFNIHLEERLPCSTCDLLADLRALTEERP